MGLKLGKNPVLSLLPFRLPCSLSQRGPDTCQYGSRAYIVFAMIASLLYRL